MIIDLEQNYQLQSGSFLQQLEVKLADQMGFILEIFP